MTINTNSSIGAGLGVGKANRPSTNFASAGAVTSFDDILENFKKVASQTPAERAADGVLKKHGLTREQFDKLPQAQKDGIQKEIEEAVRRAIGVKREEGPSVGRL